MYSISDLITAKSLIQIIKYVIKLNSLRYIDVSDLLHIQQTNLKVY